MNEIDDVTNDDLLRGSFGTLDSFFIQEKPKTSSTKKMVKKTIKRFNCKNKLNFSIFFLIVLLILLFASIIAYYILKFRTPKIKTILSNSDIKHSLFDNRYYQVIKLENNITVLMILMNNLNFTSCTLSIESGSNDDKEIPGLAYLSYKLYMQELQEGKFSKLIKSNLGIVNGDIKDNLTSFYFEIEKNQFFESFVSFSNIFQNQKDYSEKEIKNAIDDIDSGFWRDYHDENILTRQAGFTIAFDNKTRYFPSGNKETFGTNYTLLKNKIIEYRQKHFVGNKMKLAFNSDRLPYYIKGLAIKYFQTFPSCSNETVNHVHEDVPLSLNLGKIGFAQFDSSYFHNIDIFFYFDKNEYLEYEYYLKYVQYLINDKKLYFLDPTDTNKIKYSLIKMLRHLDLGKNVTTAIKTYNHSTIEFNIKIDTTILSEESGGNLAAIIEIVFCYFEALQTETPMNLIKERYENYRKIMDYNFKMRPFNNEYGSYSKKTLNNLIEHLYTNSSNFIFGEKYIPQYNETIIKGIIDNFIPEKAVIIISTKNISNYDKYLNSIIHRNCNLSIYNRESVYNMKYSSCDINVTALRESSILLASEFQIRSDNEYITDIEVPLTHLSNETDSTEIKDHIITKRHYTFYHKQDLSFDVPKVGFYFHIISPFTRPLSNRDSILNLYGYMLFNTLIEEKLGDAIDAGNVISITNNENGIIVKAMIYTPFAANITKSILDILFLNDTSYDNITYYTKNYNLSTSIIREIMAAKFKRQHEKLLNIYQILMKRNVSNLYTINIEKSLFNDLYVELRNSVRNVVVEIGFHGDITLEQAKNISSKTVETYVDFESVTLEYKYEKPNEVEIANFFHQQHYFNGYIIARFPSQLKDEDSFLVNNIYLIGNYSNQDNEDATLLSNIIAGKICEKVYEEPSGYFASFDLYKYDGAMFFSFVVQGKNGTHKQPAYQDGTDNLNTMMDFFIAKVGSDLKNITDNYWDYEGELYLAREMYIRNYWKPKMSLEEITEEIFNIIYLNTSEYISGQISREHFKMKNGDSLYNLFRKTFYSKLSKLSIQLFNYNETIPDSLDFTPLSLLYKPKLVINDYNLGLNWTMYTTSIK